MKIMGVATAGEVYRSNSDSVGGVLETRWFVLKDQLSILYIQPVTTLQNVQTHDKTHSE